MSQNFMGFNPRDLGIFKAPEAQTEQSLIYKAMPENSISEDGFYRSQIRILYNPFDMVNSIVEKQTYALHDVNGYFRVDSALSIGDRNCPIFKAWKKLHFSTTPGMKELGQEIFDKQFSRWCLIQVIDDPNKPELNGKYMFFKLPKFLWDSMIAKMNPAIETKKAPVAVMDFLIGRLVYLSVAPGPDDPKHPERKKREISYNTSEISDDIVPITREDGSSFLTDDEQAILDTYVDMLASANKNRDVKKRDAALEKLATDPITAQVAALYEKVGNELKTFCPNIGKEIAFNYYDKDANKFWNDETTARVNAFLDIAVTGRKPWESSPEMINEVAAPAPQPAAPAVEESDAPSEDLPF